MIAIYGFYKHKNSDRFYMDIEFEHIVVDKNLNKTKELVKSTVVVWGTFNNDNIKIEKASYTASYQEKMERRKINDDFTYFTMDYGKRVVNKMVKENNEYLVNYLKERFTG